MKADCNILVPQYVGYNTTCEEEARENYIEACTELINKLIDEFDIDKNRIYIYGCSFGGGCVWNMLVNHSDMIAATVELMGRYYGYKKFDEIDFKGVAKVPIWMVHSSNDNVVTIDSDDSFYNELKKYNADIKYTRPDKYGHKIAGRFLRQNKWVEWMLSHQKASDN
ncbi:MAG: dienelactone hydrolase family protein [Eubacterium sp.]